MKTFIFLLCFCVAYSTQDNLPVSVYYESLCPDSINFIVRQLNPVYKQLGSLLDVDLVPYGKAVHNKENGKWVFRCQHGPSECYGNKIQACVLQDNIPFAKKMAFVYCMMKSYDPSSNKYAQKCAIDNNLSFDSIKTCANSETGSEYLAKYGDQTHAHGDHISFVPTIMYHDTFNADDQRNSLRDFKKVVCSKLNNPPECH